MIENTKMPCLNFEHALQKCVYKSISQRSLSKEITETCCALISCSFYQNINFVIYL